MSVSAASTSGRKRTASQRALENADPVALRKKARVSIYIHASKYRQLIFFCRMIHLFLKKEYLFIFELK